MSFTMSDGPQVEVVSDETYYGKNVVRLLQHRRHGNRHDIKELTVNSNISLATHQDYVHGDNCDVIATDSQKNTIYALAKIKGVSTPEQFALDLSEHYLKTYSQVIKTRIYVEEAPWRRMDHSGKEHVHAFIMTQEAIRYCFVEQKRNGPPKVFAGLKDMRILKTTKSGFVGFVRDRFTTLPESEDRIFCTKIAGRWQYSNIDGIDFDRAWQMCKTTILDVFAGPPDTGLYSPCVQETLYLSAKKMMAKIPQIEEVTLEMPNIHYLMADLKKIGMENNGEIVMPADTPHGLIKASIRRSPNARL